MAYRLQDTVDPGIWPDYDVGFDDRSSVDVAKRRSRSRTLPGAGRRFLRTQLAVKRGIDIIVASCALLALLPLLLMIAAAIRLESPGSPIFRQYRWGKDGRTIRIFKFRSMRHDLCDVSGVMQTQENDPRVTPLGRWLRSSSFDELPQLLNVIMGDMSLVGPRCHVMGMLANGVLYEELVPEYHRRHIMRPGITGLAQVRGWRGPTNTLVRSKARIESDLYYVENFNLWLDVKILAATVRMELLGGGSGF